MDNFEPIRSRDNRRLVELRKIRDGRESEFIFIEGKRLAGEALRSPIEIVECFIDEERIDAELMGLIEERQIEVHRVATKIFASIADTETPQGIIFTARRPAWSLDDLSHADPASGPIIFLNEISNPSNLGALLRTAEAAGVAGVIVSGNSTDAYSPKALRASMGSAFRVKIIEGVPLHDAARWTASNGYSSVALDVSGRINYSDVDWTKPRMVVFGSEAHGLSGDELNVIDQTVVIPMANGVESLNLAVSAGIVLFEAKRQNASG